MKLFRALDTVSVEKYGKKFLRFYPCCISHRNCDSRLFLPPVVPPQLVIPELSLNKEVKISERQHDNCAIANHLEFRISLNFAIHLGESRKRLRHCLDAASRREIRFTRASKYRASTLRVPSSWLVASLPSSSPGTIDSRKLSLVPFDLSLSRYLFLFLGSIRCSRSRRLIFFLCLPQPRFRGIVWPIGVVARVCTLS